MSIDYLEPLVIIIIVNYKLLLLSLLLLLLVVMLVNILFHVMLMAFLILQGMHKN